MNWNFFAIYYGWMMLGFIFHLLLKFANAHNKPGYSGKIFIERNWTTFLLGWFAGSVLVLLLVSRNEPVQWLYFVLCLTFGYMGSSVLKNVMKLGNGMIKNILTKWFGKP